MTGAKTCGQCGTKLSESAKFCRECGAAVEMTADIEMFAFADYELHEPVHELEKHILLDIKECSPDLVLIPDLTIAGLLLEHFSQFSQFSQTTLTGQPLIAEPYTITEPYTILVNRECSLKWLCNTVALIRSNKKMRAILISNFPRNVDPPVIHYTKHSGGTVTSKTEELKECSLSLRDESDTRSLVIYFPNFYSSGYLKNNYTLQNRGKEKTTRCQMLVYTWDAGPDRNLIETSEDISEKRRILQKITEEIEEHGTSVGYMGGILLE